MDTLKNKAAIVGIGETKIGKLPGTTPLQLHAEAARKAIEDAGLTKNDIDGVLTGDSRVDPHMMHSLVFSEYMQIFPRYTTSIKIGGASHCAMVLHAAMAINAGLANFVLIASGENLRTGFPPGKAVEEMAKAGHPQFETPYGIHTPGWYALAAQRHMYEYGTTSEQLAQVAVAMRKHASLNPNAHMRDPITVDDVLNSRMICTPFHLLDCSPISDGGGAIIVTSVERAKDLRKPPVYVLGGGEGHTHDRVSQAPSLTSFGSRIAGEKAFQMAGVTPKDIDMAGIYDSFTIAVISDLEELGFCEKGEGGQFVEGGRIELGGELPVNTHGGLLSCGHPGTPGGLFHIIEVVRQLRGEAGNRQVKDAQVGLAHGSGRMLGTHCVIIVGR